MCFSFTLIKREAVALFSSVLIKNELLFFLFPSFSGAHQVTFLCCRCEGFPPLLLSNLQEAS